MTRGGLYQNLISLGLCCVWLMGFVQTTAQAQAPLWSSTAKSTAQHPIEVARFGSGNQFVLIVGSLSGNEPESLELMESACRLAQKIAPPAPLTLLFVRTLNPDGVADHVYTNSRGVDLNRNFPSRYFTSIPSRLTGPAPASEVETQFLLKVIEEYRPVRVIHVRSGFGERPLILANPAWCANGKPMVLPKDVNHGFFDHALKAGSLEAYIDQELNGAVATVTLSATGSRTFQPAELLRFATSNVPASTPIPDSLANRTPPPEQVQPASSPANTPAAKVPDAVMARGDVEFLPTPPEYITTAQPEQAAAPADSRYFELPTPPH